MLNVVVMTSPSTGSITLNGYLPYEDDCVSLKRVDLGQWTYDHEINFNRSFEEIFPAKADDMKQCPLFVAPFTMQPFVIQAANNWFGLDIFLLGLISKYLNFSTEILHLPERTPRSEIMTLVGSIFRMILLIIFYIL